jgi:hypothetical protein
MSELRTTGQDHIPEEFTLEGLQASLTDEEIAALTGEDNILEAAPEAEPEMPEIAEIAAIVYAEVPSTASAEQKILDVEAKLLALEGQYEEGEVTKPEKLAIQAALIKDQARAQVEIERAAFVVNQNVQTRRSLYSTALDEHKKAFPFLWDEGTVAGWDRHLKLVTGNSAYEHIPMAQRINLAHEMLATEMRATSGKSIAGPAAGNKPAIQADDQRKGPRQDRREDPVTTLAGLNGDPSNEITNGTFGAIDREMASNPMGAEGMAKTLTHAQREAWLNG